MQPGRAVGCSRSFQSNTRTIILPLVGFNPFAFRLLSARHILLIYSSTMARQNEREMTRGGSNSADANDFVTLLRRHGIVREPENRAAQVPVPETQGTTILAFKF